MSIGCLCDCGHRTPQHELLWDGRTPCTECKCTGFVHADDDPHCEFKDSPKNKKGYVDMSIGVNRAIQLFEPLLGPKPKKEKE